MAKGYQFSDENDNPLFRETLLSTIDPIGPFPWNGARIVGVNPFVDCYYCEKGIPASKLEAHEEACEREWYGRPEEGCFHCNGEENSWILCAKCLDAFRADPEGTHIVWPPRPKEGCFVCEEGNTSILCEKCAASMKAFPEPGPFVLFEEEDHE